MAYVEGLRIYGGQKFVEMQLLSCWDDESIENPEGQCMQNSEILEWYEYVRPTLIVVHSLNFIDLNDKDEPLKSSVTVE